MRNSQRVHGPRPLKELGQHFLLDEGVAYRIAQATGLGWEDRVIEIGPGRGVLLRFLLKLCQRVTAIEIDTRLKKSLDVTFGGHPGLEVIYGDFLQFDLIEFIQRAEEKVGLAGNIPYALSAPILLRIFETAAELQAEAMPPLQSATLMLQREVARRIAAQPGGREYGGITVLRELVGEAELLFDVPADAFHPPPKVTSSVIRLQFPAKPKYEIEDIDRFKLLVHHVFRQRRKMLKNSLAGLPWLKPNWRQITFDLSLRPEELSASDFITLYQLSCD